MATFNDFVSTELPLRPFVRDDGAAGQTLVRSTNPLAPRELVWTTPAVGAKGDTGSTGSSAYQIAVSLGYQGTEAAWLASLKGDKGDAGTAGVDGKDGKDGLNGTNGTNGIDGASAFALAQTLGFTGTLSEWLASLKGTTGDQGIQGIKGDTGLAGKDGVDGIDGVKGDTGSTGQSAYELAVLLGFVGDQTSWIASLKGATGTIDTSLLTNEINRAATVENDLSSRITAETTARITADEALQNAINSLTSDVNDLKTNEAGEIVGISQTQLDAKVAIEAAARAAADSDLAGMIAAIPAGQKGDTGASAYDIAIALGYSGTQGQWLSSLVGPSGKDGLDGISIKGDQGIKGDTGNTGADGRSAYEIAVYNGFSGTEIQWLLSLKGTGTGDSIVYQTPLTGVEVNTTGVIDAIDFTQYSQAVWDVVIQTYNKIRRFTVASLYNRTNNKLSYTTYGIIGDIITHKISIGFDSLTNTIKLYIQNLGTEPFVASALRYPVKST